MHTLEKNLYLEGHLGPDADGGQVMFFETNTLLGGRESFNLYVVIL